jgi:outer membrane usher protein
MAPRAVWGLSAFAVAWFLLCAPSRADERPLVLEMVLNGRATGILGNFTDRDGLLYATPAELADLGFLISSKQSDSQEAISVNDLPGVAATVNERTQTIVIKAADSALRPQQLNGPRDFRANTAITPPMTGLVLNYAILATEAKGDISGGGQIDTRFFSRYGTASTTAYGLFSPAQGQNPVVRLDTNWTYAEPDKVRRWRAGDLITGALGYTRPVRLGGFQIATDFGLRPDLVTFPLPQLSGSTLVPTTVDILVNGVRQLSQPVTPGPFEIRSLPIVTGAGEVAIAVQDELGRQTVTRVPFYASSELLTPDLLAYSLEGGFIRQRYSQLSNNYGQPALVATARRGMTDWLTLDAHSELTPSLANIGGGGDVRIGTLGVFSLVGAASTSTGDTGWTVSASAQRLTNSYSLEITGALASPGYRDIAGLTDATLPRTSFRVSAGLPLGALGSIGVAYVSQHPYGNRLGNRGAGGSDISLLTMSYQAQVADRVNFYTTGYANFRGSNPATGQATIGYGAMVGLSITFGGNYGLAASASNDGGRASYITQLTKAASETGEYGVHITDSEGFAQRRLGEFDYYSGFGHANLGVDQSDGNIATRAGFAGSVVAGGGGVSLAQTIDDSFAIVRTGTVENVGVLYENRPIGRTDSSGRLLVPYLRAYQSNRITLNANDLPPDITAGKTDVYVRPPERSGVIVDFDVRGSNAALLRLHDGNDQPLPVGSIVQRGGADAAVVGYDGEVYITDLDDTNDFQLQLPDGSACGISFPYKHVAGDLPVIGPLRCN